MNNFKKFLALFLVLALLSGNLDSFSGLAIASNNAGNSTENLLIEKGSELKEGNVSGSDISYNPSQEDSTTNPVEEILKEINVTNAVYNNQPRGKFLVHFKDEYIVHTPSVTDEVYADTSFPKTFSSSNARSSDQPELNLEYNFNLYNIKTLENINSISMDLNANQVNTLLANPMVESIEEDKPIQIAADSIIEVEDKSIKDNSQTIPWGNHATGSYMLQENKGPGEDVIKVAVMDTGVAVNHPDLTIAGGISFDDSSTDYTDNKGHGTHIAGTIAAANNSFGVLGLSPSAELYSVKVMNSSGTGYTSSVIQGLEWAIKNNIDIVNMSLVSSQYSDALHEEIQKATDSGILIIAAAGNSGAGEDTVQYPAKYPEVIAVGAVDSSYHRADFSSTGPELDLMAPGFGIMSTTMDGNYGVSSGTSNAAAHVTGSAALLWAHHRSWTAKEVTKKLYESATPLGSAAETGHGLVNVAKAEGIISGSIAPLSEENITGLNTVRPLSPKGEIETASYDLTNNGASIQPGDSITVSLKLEGDQNGNNPHSKIIVNVSSASNPETVIASQTISNPKLDVAIPYTWATNSTTSTGTYYITYHYPDLASGQYDDTFVIYVIQPGSGQDTYEPNDTFLTAKAVEPGNSYISYISSSSDLDYYKLTATQDGQITVDLSIPQTVDFEMVAYDSSGQVIGESSNGTGIAEHLELEVSKSKLYYLKIYGLTGQYSSQPYTLTLSQIQANPFKAPTGLEAVPNSNSIKLSWDIMPDATSYSLRLNNQDVGTSNTNTFTFENLDSLTGYTLQVAAVYPGGKSGYAALQSSTTIPELFVAQPKDIDQSAGKKQLYIFKPATTGVYRFYTGSYQGNGSQVDTELSIYTSVQLTKQMASNDDANDSTTFSEIKISLVSGQTYYIQVGGYDTTPLKTRITAEVVSSSIPYIYLDQAQDINEQSGSSSVYVFVPANNGKFRVGTSRYNGNSNSKINDTELTVFADADMQTPITNGYNDDKGDSLFSEVVVNLSAGTPYYIKVAESHGGKVYARLLVTSAGQTAFTPLNLGVPIDLEKPSGEEAYLQFTPSVSGQYRFFTSNLRGLSELNDTSIELFNDPELKELINKNDDARDYRPYGELFSKLEVSLTAGRTYYLVVDSFASIKGLRAQITVENFDQSSAEHAQHIQFGELVTSDLASMPLEITSLYDVDYYQFSLTENNQISLYLSSGQGALEDVNGNIRGYLVDREAESFNLEAGTYYIRVEDNALHSNRQSPIWNFTRTTYELSVDINLIEYTEGDYQETPEFLRIIDTPNDKSLDATPGSNDPAIVQYNNKAAGTKIQIEITTASAGNALVYKSSISGNFSKGDAVPVKWNGEVNSFEGSGVLKYMYANYSDQIGKYWAKDGAYDVSVFILDGKKKRNWQIFRVNVFNDYLNKLNVTPPPPKTYKGVKITYKNRLDCESVCLPYFFRYVYKPDGIGVPMTKYDAWLKNIYGLSPFEQFWENSADLVTCVNLTGKELVQCTLDNIGMIPILGEGADAVNGVIYLIDGKYGMALLSAGSIIPFVGNGFTGFKKVVRIYKNNPCGCMPEGTLITTNNGLKPIEDIAVGDVVLAKDADTGRQDFKPVQELFSNQADSIFTIKIGDTSVRATGNHPFWVKGKGWVTVDELVIGDQLVQSDGSLQTIASITVSHELTKVYNFTVADYHTYYVSELALLTHNLSAVCNISNYNNVTTKMISGRNSGGNSAILAAEITAATKLQKPPNWAAHHIIPAKDSSSESAKKLRNVLDTLGINVNSSANGVFLPPDTGKSTTIINGQTMSTHNGRHGKPYYDYVWSLIQDVQHDPVKVVEALSTIREELMTGQLKLGNLDN